MKKRFKIKCYKLSIFLLIIASGFLISLPGCSSYITYSGKIGNATYSFQYRKGYQVNPPNPLSTSTVVTDPLAPEAFIRVASHPGKEIETTLGSYQVERDPQSLPGFKIIKRDSIQIAGSPAQYITYSYQGYTTRPVEYFGQFASFEYKDYMVEIHVLFPALVVVGGPWGDGAEAFYLLVKTFKITE